MASEPYRHPPCTRRDNGFNSKNALLVWGYVAAFVGAKRHNAIADKVARIIDCGDVLIVLTRSRLTNSDAEHFRNAWAVMANNDPDDVRFIATTEVRTTRDETGAAVMARA